MEHFTQLSTYIFTLFLAALLPGPGMTGLMFKTLSQGYQAGIVMLLGLMTADMIYLSASIFFIKLYQSTQPKLFILFNRFFRAVIYCIWRISFGHLRRFTGQ